MSTESQVNANRENAQKSTGPKTKEGKEESSKNATKHGFCAQQDVIKYERQVDYDMLRQELIEDLKPIGPMQYLLADRIVSLSWRLDRAVRIQNQTIEIMLEKDALKYPGKTSRKHLVTYVWDPDLALGRIAEKDFTNNKLLERLMTYERRIENSLYKTIRELKILQSEKMKNEANYTHHAHGSRDTTHESRFTPNGPRDTSHESRINMQNKPNLLSQMNVTSEISNDYENKLLSGDPALIPSEVEESIKTHPPLADSANNQ